jgi:very-short-patch-repair endonuclease
MDVELERLAERQRGVLLRREAAAVVPVHRFDRAVRRGELRRIFPRVYVPDYLVLDEDVRRRAGLRSAGPGAALSHISALAAWGLQPALDPWFADRGIDVPDVHVTVGSGQPRGADGLCVHRRKDFAPLPPQAMARDGAATARLERALVESWPLLPPVDRRAPVIRAVRERRTTPERLRPAARELPRLPGLAGLLAVLDLLEAGCQSELEIWGYLEVFRDKALPALRRQLPIAVGRRLVYVDVAVEEVLLAIELDGRRHHSSIADIERDHRRDVALATLGWQTLRFSHRRLHEDAAGVLAEILAVVEARRRLLLGA